MLIAIDAGHGHNTAGKRAPDDSIREWDFNSATATKLENILHSNGIQTIRTDDTTGITDVPLRTRTNNMNANNVDYVISIHANAFTGNWGNAQGIETYIIARGGKAEKLANCVQNKLIESTALKNRGVKVGNLHIVRESDAPAILCECGFMDNASELVLLKSDDYRNKCAKAIADGLFEFLNINGNTDISQPSEPVKNPSGMEGYELRKYHNGSTKETIYKDCNLTEPVGYLNPWEKAECWGLFENRPIVVYKVDGTNKHKVGFAKWTGGVK